MEASLHGHLADTGKVVEGRHVADGEDLGVPGRLRSGRTAILPARSVSAAGRLGQQAGQRRGLDAGRPNDGAAIDAALLAAWALGVDPERIDADDAQPHAQLDAHLLQLDAGAPRELAAEVGQGFLAAVDQDHPDGGGIDAAEVLGQAAVGELADLSGQLHAGRAAAPTMTKVIQNRCSASSARFSAISSAP